MTYPQQPSNWPEQSWPSSPYGDPAGTAPYGNPAGSAPYGDPAGGAPYGDPAGNASSGGPAYAGSDYGYAAGGAPASPAAAYPAYGYGYGYGPPVPAGRPTNGLSIAAMVVSIVGAVGLVCYGFGGLLGVVGAILGHVARKQIRERGEGGGGMAMAGVIVGWISTALAVIIGALIVLLFVWAVKNTPSSNPYPYPS